MFEATVLLIAVLTVVAAVATFVSSHKVRKVVFRVFGFQAQVDPKLADLTEVLPSPVEASKPDVATWPAERKAMYERTGGLFLVHVYTPAEPATQQVFDAFVYVVRHRPNSVDPTRTGLDDVAKVEFYFGPMWGDHVFTVENTGSNVLGVRTQAWGTFLATCRVTFSHPGKEPIILHRYLDCEMISKSGLARATV